MWRRKFKIQNSKFKIALFSGTIAILAATAAQALTIKQPAENEQDIRVSGEGIDDNLIAIGQTVVIDAAVQGDLFVAGQSVEINAPVGGNLFAGASSLKLNSTVAQDAFVAAGNLTISEQGRIAKDLYSLLGAPAEKLKDKVGGKIVIPSPTKVPTTGQRVRDTAVAGLTLLFTGIVLLRLFPKTVKAMAENLLPHWGKNFLAGIVALIVTPIVAGFLVLSSIGAAVGLILLALWFWELYVALVVATYRIGQLILRKHPNELVQYAAGVALISAISFLPGIASTVKLVLVVFGLGSIILVKYQLYRELRSRI